MALFESNSAVMGVNISEHINQRCWLLFAQKVIEVFLRKLYCIVVNHLCRSLRFCAISIIKSRVVDNPDITIFRVLSGLTAIQPQPKYLSDYAGLLRILFRIRPAPNRPSQYNKPADDCP